MNTPNIHTVVEKLQAEMQGKYPMRRKRDIEKDLQKALSGVVGHNNIQEPHPSYKENFDGKIVVKDTVDWYIKDLFYFVDWCLKYYDQYTDIDYECIQQSWYWSLHKEEAIKCINMLDDLIFTYDNFLFKEEYIKGYFRSTFLFVKKKITSYLRGKYNIEDNKVYPKFDSHLPASPWPEAYKKVANSNLDIKPTGRDYWLLFR